MTNIIDIEASGLNFDSYPIEVAVLINGNVHSWLIKPEKNWTYWCKLAEDIHGITREELLVSGVSARQVASELEELVSKTNGILYSDAVEWDTDWIDTLFTARGFRKQFHIVSIFDLLDDEQRSVFEASKTRIAESGKYHFHRAADDVQLIEEAYKISRGI